MTFCEKHKPNGCGECPKRYTCQNRVIHVGETWSGENITHVAASPNTFATIGLSDSVDPLGCGCGLCCKCYALDTGELQFSIDV